MLVDFLGLIGTVADSFKNERFFSLYLQQISRKQAGNIAGVRDKKPAFKEAIFRDFKIEINPSFKIASHTEIWIGR